MAVLLLLATFTHSANRTIAHLTIAALAGNAGAGGGIYKNTGNLYGSEFWTYTLPKRVGAQQAQGIMQHRLPLGAKQAQRMGIVDACFGGGYGIFPQRGETARPGIVRHAGLRPTPRR